MSIGHYDLGAILAQGTQTLEALPSFLPHIIADAMVAAKRYHAQEHDTSITNDAKIIKEMNLRAGTSEHEGYASCTELCLHLSPYVKRWLAT